MLTKWSFVHRPNYQGRLDVHDLEVKNKALLEKWLARLLSEDGVWQNMLRRKYIGPKAVSQVTWKPGNSHFLVGIMATKKHFFHMVLSPSRRNPRYGSGRINGWEQPPLENNIRLCTILYVIKGIPCRKSWKHLHRL
jgi:hypothetical protein